ncbi:MerR family DNA-binding transcriptional regulator [Aliiglaciecola sp. LCG003]|uniref:MerR family transcriptional regulator n=1 Tax=Aliiglaciecola sp. LCG003 TaxID=3053655 RepID=UPI00257486BD|nr:MerR family DNA-binding transcriptional regulator [Aliiglaciecola sp. LCG003]WJG07906.1 MerR family DNA-binding transcriptional regulator [Aliiglaciecola sp. LCG003]
MQKTELAEQHINATSTTSPTTFSIGELAKSFDITPRSIRFYEEQGLIAPKRSGQARIYSKKDKVRLKLILRGKRLGFSLAETKTLFNLYDSHQNSVVQLEAMLQMTEQKRAILNQQLEDIRMLMGELDDVESRCRDELHQLTKG